MVMRYFLAMAAILNMVAIFKTSMSSGVNSSLIVSLFSGVVVLTSLIFYFMFNEKLSLKHYIGMTMIIASIILISNSRQLDSVSTIQEEGKISVLYPIMFAMLACVIFSSTTLIARLVKYTGLPSLQFSADSQLILGLIMVSMFLREHFFILPYAFDDFWPPALGSFLVICGSLSLNGACAYGKAGPA